MLHPKSNPAHVSVKKKQKNNTICETPNGLGVFKQKETVEISLWLVLAKYLKSMQIPLIAGKHQLLEKYRAYFGGQPFPWFKASLLALGLYMVFQKDMNFQINMKSPNSIISDDRQNSNEPTAMSMSLPSFSRTKAPSKKESTIGHLGLTQAKIDAYIKRFSRIAIMEMQKFQIPASIKMGQGILASNAGENTLALTYNNHFGVLCGQAATCANYDSNIGSVKIKTYPSAWEGWRDHSIMLSKNPYKSLVKECGRDYKKWAKGIARLGYDNNQEYSKQLIEIIEAYQLYKLDEVNEGM